MLNDQLWQALTLFGLGMGTVFLLLAILITCVSVLSWFCRNIQVDPKTPASPSSNESKIKTAQDELLAAELAVKRHRSAIGF